MGPTAEQSDAFHPFELFVGIITVALRKPDIIAEEFTGNLPTTAAMVIMEHDVSGDTVPQAPLITFSLLVLFIVYHRYHTLVYLYIFTRQYRLLKEIIQKLQPLHCRLIPPAHGRIPEGYPRLTVRLNKAGEWQTI